VEALLRVSQQTFEAASWQERAGTGLGSKTLHDCLIVFQAADQRSEANVLWGLDKLYTASCATCGASDPHRCQTLHNFMQVMTRQAAQSLREHFDAHWSAGRLLCEQHEDPQGEICGGE
jgi:hypothetical protein